MKSGNMGGPDPGSSGRTIVTTTTGGGAAGSPMNIAGGLVGKSWLTVRRTSPEVVVPPLDASLEQGFASLLPELEKLQQQRGLHSASFLELMDTKGFGSAGAAVTTPNTACGSGGGDGGGGGGGGLGGGPCKRRREAPPVLLRGDAASLREWGILDGQVNKLPR
jgi:hypothetical protein